MLILAAYSTFCWMQAYVCGLLVQLGYHSLTGGVLGTVISREGEGGKVLHGGGHEGIALHIGGQGGTMLHVLGQWAQFSDTIPKLCYCYRFGRSSNRWRGREKGGRGSWRSYIGR